MLLGLCHRPHLVSLQHPLWPYGSYKNPLWTVPIKGLTPLYDSGKETQFCFASFPLTQLINKSPLPVQDNYLIYLSLYFSLSAPFSSSTFFMILKNHCSVSFEEAVQPWHKGIHPQIKFWYMVSLSSSMKNWRVCITTFVILFFLKGNEEDPAQNS